MTVGGQFAGKCEMMVSSASTPPVEDPIASSRPSGSNLAAASRGRDAGRGQCMRAPAAARTTVANWSNPSQSVIRGLATQSKAPSSSARRLASAPRLVRVETITTGIGRSRMILSRNSMPFICGISTSSVSTSG